MKTKGKLKISVPIKGSQLSNKTTLQKRKNQSFTMKSTSPISSIRNIMNSNTKMEPTATTIIMKCMEITVSPEFLSKSIGSCSLLPIAA